MVTILVGNEYKLTLDVPNKCARKPEYSITTSDDNSFAALDAANNVITFKPTVVENDRLLIVTIKSSDSFYNVNVNIRFNVDP